MSDDFRSGYKKPPKETQFKKGQSGNPSGRPKDPISFEKAIMNLLFEDISSLKKTNMDMSGFDYMQRLILSKALNGDRHYIEMLLKIIKDYYAKNKPIDERRPQSIVVLPEKDIDPRHNDKNFDKNEDNDDE